MKSSLLMVSAAAATVFLWADEDGQIHVGVRLNSGTGSARSAAPSTICTAVPSTMDCI
ncbi:MAG: DUF4124 domain-containing protein, partial [Candidatus Fonsibacter sp.]